MDQISSFKSLEMSGAQFFHTSTTMSCDVNEKTSWDIDGRVCIITGANTGLGRVTALEFARQGAHVFLACRSQARTLPVIEAIRREAGYDRIEFLPLDLGSLSSVRKCVEIFLARELPLHVLVNNAGLSGQRGQTEDGFELVLGVNYLGHFLLTLLLLEKLKASAPARIVNVSSLCHRKAQGIDWDAFQNPTPFFIWPHPTYPVSKLANILFTRELARRLKDSGVTTYAVHPGVVATDIWRVVPRPIRPIIKFFMISCEKGARTQIRCATAPEFVNETGQFYVDCERSEASSLTQNDELARELWRRSEQWCNVTVS